MFLGQPWHLYIVLVVASYLLLKLAFKAVPEAPPEPVILKANFFGGPLDGRKEDITLDELPPFFMAPYLTTEQREEMMEGGRLLLPTIAYYVRVDEDNYFYKRDVTPDEIPVIQSNGGLPNG